MKLTHVHNVGFKNTGKDTLHVLLLNSDFSRETLDWVKVKGAEDRTGVDDETRQMSVYTSVSATKSIVSCMHWWQDPNLSAFGKGKSGEVV